MQAVSVFVPQQSPRLFYTLNWVLKEQLQLDYRLVIDESSLPEGFFISYGKSFTGALFIPDNGLLWQQNIAADYQPVFEEKLLYNQTTKTLSFDIFSAVFYLLSRYEEYAPNRFTPDKHNRFPATESILYKRGLLEIPVVDEWLQTLREVLLQQFNIKLPQKDFSFLPTYDIDIAWSYQNKGWKRNTGAFMKDLLAGDLTAMSSRIAVLAGREKDPYDAFDEMQNLHDQFRIRPVYFILAANRTTPFDKNILPSHPAMQALIRRLAANGTIGMHPSYFTERNNQLFEKEQSNLAQIADQEITVSRQHYIKLHLPETYHQLTLHHISDDYSMGYGAWLGFRAGTGNSFNWYDLQQEKETALRIHPFCFMDTTAHFEQKLTPAMAFERLHQMTLRLKHCNSTLITVFHNFSLGTAPEWRGWYTAYERFLRVIYG